MQTRWKASQPVDTNCRLMGRSDGRAVDENKVTVRNVTGKEELRGETCGGASKDQRKKEGSRRKVTLTRL